MIIDLFLYFAKFPNKAGLKSIATNGQSSMSEYADILKSIEALPDQSRVPDIDNYVYGQSFDDLKLRIDKLIGSFLFADYGEFDISDDGHRSFSCSERLAVTVAFKMPSRADILENVIASDRSLKMLSEIHAWMMADSEAGDIPWLERDSLDKAEIIPFVATELSSIGWTLMLNASGSDSLGTHNLCRSFAKQIH